MDLTPEPEQNTIDDDYVFDECFRTFIGNQQPKYIFQTNDGDEVIWETMFFNLADKNQTFTFQTLLEEESYHLNRNSLIQYRDSENKTVNYGNLVTPKFLKKAEALISKHPILKSLFANACYISVVLSSSNMNGLSNFSQSCTGTGIIVFKSVEKQLIMLYTCAHLFFPEELSNPIVNDISVNVSDGYDLKRYSARIVSMGDFASKREDFNDWALLQIETDEFTDDLMKSELFIPSPTSTRELDHHCESNITPDNYTTLLIGYFSRGSSRVDRRETKRMKELGINIEDVWKIIPEGLSLSFGWTVSCRDKTLNTVHNCASTTCCSGGPLLKCRIKTDELMLIGNMKPSKEKSEKLISLFEKGFVSRTILGLHSGGIAKGNTSCSSFYFFENYYEQVYSPHKNEFSDHDQAMIELEYEEFSKLK